MKKLLVMMLILVMSIVMLTGCGSDVEDAGSGETSEVVSEENIENSEAEVSGVVETDTEEDETLDVSVENSEIVEEITMYSADEVMAHIDTLIAQYTYNDPEHIKALVIAANMDYIAEEDLNVILTEYRYTVEELAVLYDECIVSSGASLQESFAYSQGQVDILTLEDAYVNRITLEAVVLDFNNKENVKWLDKLMFDRSQGNSNIDDLNKFSSDIENCGEDISSFERTYYSYTYGTLCNNLLYTDYLDNPYTYYINSNL